MNLYINDQNSHYIGDGAYAHKDSMNRLWLVTYNGIDITNQICLEDDVLKSLLRFYRNNIGEINYE